METVKRKVEAAAPSSSYRNPSATAYYAAENSDDSDSDMDGANYGLNGSETSFNMRGASCDQQDNFLEDENQLNVEIIKEKNREHAKNTRIRRKNFIETLKDDIQHTISVREMRERDRKSALSKLAAQVSDLVCEYGRSTLLILIPHQIADIQPQECAFHVVLLPNKPGNEPREVDGHPG